MIITNIKIYMEDQTVEPGCIYTEGDTVVRMEFGDIQVEDVFLEEDPDIVDGNECIVIAGKIGPDRGTEDAPQFGPLHENMKADLILISEDQEVIAVIENGEFLDID